MAGALDDFLGFTKDFRSLIALTGKALIVLPLGDFVLNIGPSWPNKIGITGLLSVLAMLILGYSFEFWRGAGTLSEVRTTLAKLMWVVIFLCLLYMTLFAFFVKEVPDMWHRESVGLLLLPDVAELVESSPSQYPAEKLLELFDGNPARIWQPWSVYLVRVTLLAAWLAFWMSFFSFVAAFVSIQWRRQNSAKLRRGRREPAIPNAT